MRNILITTGIGLVTLGAIAMATPIKGTPLKETPILETGVKGEYAIGVILNGTQSIQAFKKQFEVSQVVVDCSTPEMENTCSEPVIKFGGVSVKVFAIGSQDAINGLGIPLTGSVITNTPTEEELIRFMKEHGVSNYKLIYE